MRNVTSGANIVRLNMCQRTRQSIEQRKLRGALRHYMVTEAFAGAPLERRWQPQSDNTARWLQGHIIDKMNGPFLSVRTIKRYLQGVPDAVAIMAMKRRRDASEKKLCRTMPAVTALLPPEQWRDLHDGAWAVAERLSRQS